MRFSASCLMGTEGLAAQELKELSCENVQAENGRVLFSGGWDILARANINSRYAERIGILMGEFPARSCGPCLGQSSCPKMPPFL